ncbi:MAG: hypothetical protein U0U70_13215 [Chitinophagaceae bacterium]
MDLTEQLQKKISSKMDIAKFFAGFISLSISLSASKLSDWINNPEPLCYVTTMAGIFLILISLALSVATMFAYDRLLMPPEFWKTPPSRENINETLFCEMIKAWTYFFRYAVYTFFGGLICFFIQIIQGAENLTQTTRFIFIGGLLLVPIIIIVLYHRYSKIGNYIHRDCIEGKIKKINLKE